MGDRDDDDDRLKDIFSEEDDDFISDQDEEDDDDGRVRSQDKVIDDDDEEDEDGDEQPVKKKKRTAASMFIEEEAAVDDDEEEEFYDEDDDFAGEEDELDEEIKERYLDDRTHREFDRRRQDLEDQDAEELAAKIQERYKRNDYGRNYQDGLQEGDQRLLIPSVSDPKLWLVRCKPGREKDVVFTLMRKYMKLEYDDHPLRILSAFTRDSLQGYIYIEAEKQAFVQQAIDRMLNVYASKLQLVPVNEMVDCLHIKKKDYQLNPGAWVRVKRGKYERDLAQILDVYDTDESAKIKLVPRIDFNGDTPIDKKRKKMVRLPQKLFSPDLIKDKRSLQSLTGGYIQHGGDVFDRKGFMEKTVKLSALLVDDIQPTLEEITMFTDGAITEDANELLALAQNATKTATGDDFQIGETVQVTEGALMNLVGVIKSIQKDIITIQPAENLGLDNSLQFPAHQLRKKFREGEHVKVQHGLHKDEMGLIINVEGNVVTILSDTQMKPIQVFLKDLMRAADHTSIISVGAAQQYDVHDLVQLSPNEVAVILKVEKDLLHILNQHGAVLKVRPQQVKLRRDARSKANSFSTDAQNNSFSIGDVVQIQDPMRPETNNRRGTVLHIYRSFVFLHSREVLEHNGVFVAKNGTVVVASSKARSGMASQRSTGTRGPTGYNGQNPGTSQPQQRGGYGRRDPYLGKTVTLRKGPYKGYIGVLKDVIDGMARVELHTNAKIISISRESVSGPGENRNGGFRAGPPARGGFDGGRTPMYNSGSKTPMYRGGNDYGMTPNPYADGSRTPAWNSGSRTPGYNAGSRTPAPAWDSGSRTPGWNAGGSSSTGGWGKDNDDNNGGTWESSSTSYNRPNEREDSFANSGTGGNDWSSSSFGTRNESSANEFGDSGWGGSAAQDNYSRSRYDHNLAPATNDGGWVDTSNVGGGTVGTTNTREYDSVEPSANDGGGWGNSDSFSNTETSKTSKTEIDNKNNSSSVRSSEWLTNSIEVFIKSRPNRPIGVITEAQGRTAQVRLLDSKDTVSVSNYDVEPVIPEKKQRIKFVGGEYEGQLGTLIGINGPDAIVRLQDKSDFKIQNMSLVAKYNDEY